MAQKITAFLNHPEQIFVLIALLFGLMFSFMLPTGAGFDETTHLARVLEVSAFKPIPNELLPNAHVFPFVFIEVNYRRKPFSEPVPADFFDRYKNQVVNWYDGDNAIKTSTRSVYFPLLYVPPAAVFFLARHLHFSVLEVYYLSRLAECLGYILLCYFAIRLIPFGKWILTVLALSPIAVLMSGTINTDPYTNGAAFLFVGWVLYLVYQETPISLKQVGITALTILLLFSVKLNAAYLILLLVLLPRRKFQTAKGFYALLAVTAVLFLVVVVYWNGVVIRDFRTDDSHGGAFAQIGFILTHPLQFANIFFTDLARNWQIYLRNWIAVYPYSLGVVPPLVFPLYIAALVLTTLTDVSRRPVPKTVRAALLSSFFIGYLFTVLTVFLALRGSNDNINIQGRYLTVVAPGLFLGLVSTRPRSWHKFLPPAVPAAGAFLSLAGFAVGLYLTFYVTCGSSYYTPGLCQLPIYRNRDATSTFTGPVTRQAPVVQEFKAQCSPIHSISVWPVPVPGKTYGPGKESGASTVFQVRDLKSGELLAQSIIPNSQVPGGKYFEFPIAPIQNAVDRSYAIEISSDNPDAHTALNFAISPNQEYNEGGLTIAGQAVEHDLYFRYGCKVEK